MIQALFSHKYTYGKAEILGYEQDGRIRKERYIPDDGGKQKVEYIHCANKDDRSPRRSGAHYDENCACCWLGYAHTELEHFLSVEKRKVAENG